MTRVAATTLLFGGLALGFSALSFAGVGRTAAALAAALGGAATTASAALLLARSGGRDGG